VRVPSYTVSPSNPDNSVDWSRYYPISGAGSVYYKNKTSYVMQYNLTVEPTLRLTATTERTSTSCTKELNPSFTTMKW
jgi:hypothetical protein